MYLALALLSSLVLGAADFVGGAAARRTPAAVIVIWSNAAGLLAASVRVVLVVPGTVGLARLLLRERIRVIQGVGAAQAMGSVVLLAWA